MTYNVFGGTLNPAESNPILKGVSWKVIVDRKGIKDSWKDYAEKLMNEENE